LIGREQKAEWQYFLVKDAFALDASV